MPKKLHFEDCVEIIDKEIAKRRQSWKLQAVPSIDYDDISQILRIHIHKKWHLYDQTKPLVNWVNRIISYQIINLLRNFYSSTARPCLRCPSAVGETGCMEYGEQCSSCPLYANWERTKKHAHNCRLPVPLENHAQEVFNLSTDALDFDKLSKELHEKIRPHLKPNEWEIYKHLYIAHRTEEETAKIMNYKHGLKQIKNIQKVIISKAKLIIYEVETDE